MPPYEATCKTCPSTLIDESHNSGKTGAHSLSLPSTDGQARELFKGISQRGVAVAAALEDGRVPMNFKTKACHDPFVYLLLPSEGEEFFIG